MFTLTESQTQDPLLWQMACLCLIFLLVKWDDNSRKIDVSIKYVILYKCIKVLGGLNKELCTEHLLWFCILIACNNEEL